MLETKTALVAGSTSGIGLGIAEALHRLRHVIQLLASELPAALKGDAHIRELASWGCRTTMQVADLVAPRLPGEDTTKDIDYTPAGIRARSEAGMADTMNLLRRVPSRVTPDAIEGVVECQ